MICTSFFIQAHAMTIPFFDFSFNRRYNALTKGFDLTAESAGI